MKLQILAFAVFVPLTATSALSLSQEQQAGSSDVPATSASTHHPLFTIKYVLVPERPGAAKDAPRIEQDDDRAAIRALPLSSGQWPAVPLNGGFWNPNMYVCSGWGCRDVY